MTDGQDEPYETAPRPETYLQHTSRLHHLSPISIDAETGPKDKKSAFRVGIVRRSHKPQFPTAMSRTEMVNDIPKATQFVPALSAGKIYMRLVQLNVSHIHMDYL